MQIAGLMSNSFVDYPKKIAAVVFTSGCNMNCYYCHNRELIRGDAKVLYSPSVIIDKISRGSDMLDGVVITGGEPTLQGDLAEFLHDLRIGTGLPVKLDTNGILPEVMQDLIDKRLVDYIAMDVKATLVKYEAVCLCNIDIDKILESIKIIRNFPEHEFRTTFTPDLTTSDIIEIAKLIYGAKLYVLQQYKVPKTGNFHDKRLSSLPHKIDAIKAAETAAKKYIKNTIVRGI